MKKFKIFLMLSILLCFGFALSTEVHAQGVGPKPFEIGEVLPATTQLKISWNSVSSAVDLKNWMYDYPITTDSHNFIITFGRPFSGKYGGFLIDDLEASIYDRTALYPVFYNDDDDISWVSPYDTQRYCIIDISNLTVAQRTVSSAYIYSPFTWEDLNAPSGYTITFNSHGGTTIPDIEGATVLPTPLPTPIKSGYTFVAWYYDIEYTQIANAGDILESNVTLYAKWGRTFAPKIFEVGDVLSPGQIKISWDFSEITISEDDFIRIEGTNDFAIYMAVEDVSNSVEMSIMGYYTDIIKGNIMINLDDISVITEIKSDGNSDFWHILDALSWEYIGDYQDGYDVGYTSAREYYGFYDSSSNEWLSVTEYIDRYGTDKMNQTDFYNNFDKYFIPAMIIVFGGAIVLTLLKVFKGRE